MEDGGVIGIGRIEAVGLIKHFGKIAAVNDVSFSVGEAEFFGLLGPNGAGKTTTIRLLTGILRPDAGNITIDGIDLLAKPFDAKMRIGAVPEVGNIYADLSAMENLDLLGRYYGLSKDERRLRSKTLLEKLSLWDRRNDLVRKYSKGMKQRVSVACALIHEPPVLFLDEPTEGLDVQSRRIIINLVKQMNRKGSSIILTTHNIEEASRLCERVCIINHGKILAISSPEQLRMAYEKNFAVEVSFNGKIDRCLLEEFAPGKIEEWGDKFRLPTDDPDKTIQKIIEVRREHDLRIVSIQTVRPSLEDVFVKLTEEPK
ncbi:MAG: ATP-binding cassette domain-containing protein [Thermoplasmata archaeon]